MAMDAYAKYAASSVCLGAALILPLRFALDPLVTPDPLASQLVETLDAGPVDVLFFGDSVTTTTGVCDTGDERIPDVLAQLTDARVLTIAHWAYSPIVFREYARLLRRTAHRPRLAILPLNVRTFADQFYGNPDFHFPERRLRIRRLADGLRPLDFPAYVAGVVRHEIAEFRQDTVPVVIDGVTLGTNAEIEERAKIHAILECLPDPYDYAEELSLRFTYHYMGRIPEDHPLFGDLEATVRELRDRGVAVLAYVTPVNVEEGAHYVGPELARRVRSNADLILRHMQRLDVPTLDLVDALPARDFIDKSYACEHVNQVGRSLVAEALARHIEANDLF